MTLEWRLWRTLTPSFSGTTCRSLNSIRLEISAFLLAGCMHVISFSPKPCSLAQGLPTVLPRLPPRVALHRVLPCLAKVQISQRNVTLAAPFFPTGIRQSRYGPLCSSVCTLYRTRSECYWTRTRPCSWTLSMLNIVQLSSGKQSRLCATCSSQSEACDEVDGANPDLADIHAGALLRFCPKTSGHIPASRKWSCSWRKHHLKMFEVMFSPWCIGRSSQEFHRFRNFAFP